ncbi:MAG: hypothetical protein JST30_08585 [Armatimonadetes bacterium]|nr:hypothetical protein [Armatimonadota bacterium]
MPHPFDSHIPWNPERPHVLVVACSDGRLQENLDEFLDDRLQVKRYDRLYLPGGPGALSASGAEFVRSDGHRKELAFLLHAHEIEMVLLIFHGPSSDGPAEALCADYARFMAGATVEAVRDQQAKDFQEVRDYIRVARPTAEVRGYRLEVKPNGSITFVNLDPAQGSVVPQSRGEQEAATAV